ncbi:MAG: hypothetical protein IKZ33_05460, partial [Lentisphaeria bacterium]|nr:hypothetical protein [Lentisphaeria bacterium]
FCFTSKGCFNCAASAIAEAMAGQAASQACLRHGEDLFGQSGRKALPGISGIPIINQPSGQFRYREKLFFRKQRIADLIFWNESVFYQKKQ